MILSGSTYLLLTASMTIVIGQVTDNCALYNSFDWPNDDVNIEKIGGIYSGITTNIRDTYGDCRVHGVTLQENGDIIDRFIVPGSPCKSVYQIRFTRVANSSTVFESEFFGDDPLCNKNGYIVDAKIKALPDGSCFFKSFCLLDGRSVVNLLCRNPNVSLLSLLLTPVLNLVLALLGNSLYYIDQSCYAQIINNSTDKAMLLG